MYFKYLYPTGTPWSKLPCPQRRLWDTMKRKNDSKFVGDLRHIFWGTETLKNKCQDKSKIKDSKGNSVREELTPEKVVLLYKVIHYEY